MSSLKFIMDPEDEEPQGSSRPSGGAVEKGKAISGTSTTTSGTSSRDQGQDLFKISPLPSHASVSLEADFNRVAVQDRDWGGSQTLNSVNISETGAAGSSSSAQLGETRRRSSASTDSMDPRGYFSATSSSSYGGGGSGGGQYPPNRLMGTSTGPEPKLTPITGRVSRAKKGFPVHTCEICRPPKTFTRAEHLRRHQLGHGTPGYPCTYPGCTRTFHRRDLLTRHQQRHEQEGDRIPRASPETRQISGLPPDAGFASDSLNRPHGGPASLMTRPDQVPSGPSSEAPSTSNTPHYRGQGNGGYQHIPQYQQLSGSTGTSIPSERRQSNDYAPQNYTLGSLSAPNESLQPSLQYDGRHSIPSSHPEPAASYQPRTSPPMDTIHQGTAGHQAGVSAAPTEFFGHSTANAWSVAPVSEGIWSSESQVNQTYQLAPGHQSPAGSWQVSRGVSGLPTSFRPSNAQNMNSQSNAMDPFAGPYPVTVSEPPNMGLTEDQLGLGQMYEASPVSSGLSSDEPPPLLVDSGVGTSPAQLRPRPHLSYLSSVRSMTPVLLSNSNQTAESLVMPSSALSDPATLAHLSPQKEATLIENADADLMTSGILGLDDNGASLYGYPSDSLLAAHGLAGLGGCNTGPLAIPVFSTLSRNVLEAIPMYLEIYWQRVHTLYPIAHRGSFEASGNPFLRCAMAAMAAQVCEGKEHQIRGVQLQEYAWSEAKKCAQWDLQLMQAMLLCEFFTRFRGKRVVTKSSVVFESIYSRMLEHIPTIPSVALPSGTIGLHGRALTAHERWHIWLDVEMRRRLLAACFVFDMHTSMYQEQARVRDFAPSESLLVPLTGSSAALWDAESADAWSAILDKNGSLGTPHFLSALDTLIEADVMSLSAFDQRIALCALVMRLRQCNDSHVVHTDVAQSETLSTGFDNQTKATSHPENRRALSEFWEEKISTLFRSCPVAQTYLTLHHTPLTDLMAVTGESWVFSKKVLPLSAYEAHKVRLASWVSRPSEKKLEGSSGSGAREGQGRASEHPPRSLARATKYAARAIELFLDDARHGGIRWQLDISAYWGLYICTLVCWAASHGSGRLRDEEGDDASGSRSSSTTTAKTRKRSRASMASGPDDETMGWLRSVANMKPEEAVLACSGQSDQCKNRGRRQSHASGSTTTTTTSGKSRGSSTSPEIAGLIRLVRQQMEDSRVAGGANMLFVDAVGVLRKLEDGKRRRSF